MFVYFLELFETFWSFWKLAGEFKFEIETSLFQILFCIDHLHFSQDRNIGPNILSPQQSQLDHPNNLDGDKDYSLLNNPRTTRILIVLE